MVNAEFPEKLQPLFLPYRYKVLCGGRGGAKSWGVARALLILGSKKPLRVLCAREFQKSIKDSVHKLLSDQIDLLGLSSFYDVQQAVIKGKNGTSFNFEGLKYNTTSIKSYEAANICWVEEAQTVSRSSWEVLIPTIRADDSEIWVTFNPELEEDETYQRFIMNPPPNAVVIKINHSDNPWFPAVLQAEMEYLKSQDMDAYLNIWEGHCRKCLEGAIYSNELRKAQEDGRITRVPYDASTVVNTFWDLGWADNTSIWFVQHIGFEIRIIDFYQNNLQPLQHYAQVLNSRGYVLDTCYLPHDARAIQLGSGRSTEELLGSMGFKVKIVPKLSVFDGIQAARTIFSACYFDEKKCSDGLHSLRRYRYDVDPDTKKFGKEPLHDCYSHAADAFRYVSVGINEKNLVNKFKIRYNERAEEWSPMDNM